MHRLTAIFSRDSEVFLGDYEDLYKAVDSAEVKYTEYNTFRICKNLNCLVGVRMGPGVFWRIPREEKRGRDSRVMDLLDDVISKFKHK